MNGSSEEPGKLFIGGLSWETTQDNLQRFFSRYGEVIDCVVMKNNETGRSRGFGFVTFKDPECVNIVLSGGPHELDGRTIDPKSCNPRGTTTSKAPSSSGKVRSSTTASSKGGNYPKVFLGGLPSSVTETDLRMFFSKYGKVVEVVIMYDQERKKSRGFGFLSFDNEDSVDRVCLEHYVTVNGKQVECKRAEPRDSGTKRSGGGGGGGGGGSMGGGGGGGGGSWGNSNMMGGGNSSGWGGPMGQGGPSGGMSGQQGMGMANGMMPSYQGGWGNTPQQQAAPYQGGYGSNYQGWANQSGFNPYAGGSTTGAAAGTAPQSQYSQPGAGAAGFSAGYGGGFNQMGGNQPQMGGANGQMGGAGGQMGANPSVGMSNDAYGQQGSAQTQNSGGQQGAGAAGKSEYSNYDFGTGYSQSDGGPPSSGSRSAKSGGGYHPYQRS